MGGVGLGGVGLVGWLARFPSTYLGLIAAQEVVLPHFRKMVQEIKLPGAAEFLEMYERELAIRKPWSSLPQCNPADV